MSSQVRLVAVPFGEWDIQWEEFLNIEIGLQLRTDDNCNRTYSNWVTIDDFSPAPVPEPTTMLLLSTGLIGLVGLRRKLKK